MIPGPLTLTLSGSSVNVAFASDVSAASYNVYRSLTALVIGSLVGSIAYAPGTLTYADGTTSYGQSYFYRVSAVDSLGHESFPSDAVQVNIEDSPFVHDTVLGNIVATLKADATLMGLCSNGPNAIRWQHKVNTMGDIYPFIVIWRTAWDEDKRWSDGRVAKVQYTMEVYYNQPSAQRITDVINRLALKLNGEAAKNALSSASVSVAWSFFVGAGPEFYDENLKLWGQPAKQDLTVEFLPS